MSKKSNRQKLEPFFVFSDGTTRPFGDYNQDGVYQLNMTDTMNKVEGVEGGYTVEAIYGVSIPYKVKPYSGPGNGLKNEPSRMTAYKTHVFIGECPHQDGKGAWVTYNNVPNFIVDGKFLATEDNEPYFIRLLSEAHYATEKHQQYETGKKLASKMYNLEQQLEYCTFKTYAKGLKHRFERWLKRHTPFVSYTGENTYHFGVENPRSEFQFCYWHAFKNNERYIMKVTDETVTKWTFYDGKKFTWKKDSWTNDHCYCAC